MMAVVQMLMHYTFWRKNHDLEKGDTKMLNFWDKVAFQFPLMLGSKLFK
jgi:hypothetical protein